MQKNTKIKRSNLKNDLVEKIIYGDAIAFEKLFLQYFQPLIYFAFRYLQNTAESEDVVQDVFVKIWSNRAKLRPDLNIKSYLYVAVKNHSLKNLRHKKVKRVVHKLLRKKDKYSKTPEDLYSLKDSTNKIYQSIEKLPEKCRIIFSMSRFDNLKYAEIAEILSISIKTVESQMGRALKFLRNDLAEIR